ncbi:PadR family transcriptional regulator [Agreia pratensis]|uniref:PadR family transcriptional regulator n=1 Tax=Agreia pratensis TaxID=150121 RepID=UPI00188DA495|nr:PadR family transcriptional regulator [Agreia pratensis]MBF4634242.1 PadR family transcriptional regulator [Agreia pratensis]
MSVRSGILAVLSLGPAYGSQVHGEVETRMHRVGAINVGQIYSTLDRLQSQGSVVNDGMTGDGLPLYTLTERGRAEVATWLTEPDTRAGWTDFVGHVLLVASLPDAPIGALIDAYRQLHESRTPPADSIDGPLDELGLRSGEILSTAAIAWLDEVQDVLARVDCARPLGSFRPRRGRRPRREDI